MNIVKQRLEGLLSRITYPGMVLELSMEGAAYTGLTYFLRWTEPTATCNTTGQPYDSKGRKWRLSQHMTDGEVVGTAFKALLTYQEHEARERFTFDGVSVYDSHVDIHRLVALRKDLGCLSVRDEPAEGVRSWRATGDHD